MTYTSIFDRSCLVYKHTLCELLNLNVDRPGLMFSATEIKRAYKKRVLRFHPDLQAVEQPIPKDDCQRLMQDIDRARTMLLDGEYIILSKQTQPPNIDDIPENWLLPLLHSVRLTRAEWPEISKFISDLHFFNYRFIFSIMMASFSEGELNFQLMNLHADKLKAWKEAVHPNKTAINVPGLIIQLILRLVKNYADRLSPETHVNDIKQNIQLIETLARLPQNSEQTLNDYCRELIVEMNRIKPLISNQFIHEIDNIVALLSELSATAPSWRDIIQISLISLLFNANSLSKHINASFVIGMAIFNHKGLMAFSMAFIPLILITLGLLPLNLFHQLIFQLGWLCITSFWEMVTKACQFAFSMASLVFTLDFSYQNSIVLFEQAMTAFIRGPIILALEMLNRSFYFLINIACLDGLIEIIDRAFDCLLDWLKPTAQSSSLPQARGFFDEVDHSYLNRHDRFLET